MTTSFRKLLMTRVYPDANDRFFSTFALSFVCACFPVHKKLINLPPQTTCNQLPKRTTLIGYHQRLQLMKSARPR